MEEIKQHCEKIIQMLRSDYNTQLQYSGIIKKIYDVMLQIISCDNVNELLEIKMIRFLISMGAGGNFKSPKDQRNALHIFYFSVLRPEPQYMLRATQLLVEAGIDINRKDKYGAIPLKYAITVVKLTTEEIMPVYKYLIDHGSNIYEKDSFDKTCVDYVKEYSWRNGLISLLGGEADENK